MIRIKYLLLINITLLLLSCNLSNKKIVNQHEVTKNRTYEIKKTLEKKLQDFNINADINNDIKDNKIEVIITFKKPYRIVDKDFQIILMSYLAYYLFNDNIVNDDIYFRWFLDDEKNIDEIEKIFKTKEVGDIFDNNPTFVSLLQYSFKNFERIDALSLSMNCKAISQIFPEVAKNDSFFNLLFQFSKTKRPTIKNNADIIFILYYSYSKYIIEESKIVSDEKKDARKIEIRHLAKLWKIAKEREIDREKDFLDIVNNTKLYN